MALTASQRRKAAVEFARRAFRVVNKTATLNLSDLEAAVDAIDATMNLTPPNLTANQTIKANLANALPEPFASESTAQEKALALCVWAMAETGLL